MIITKIYAEKGTCLVFERRISKDLNMWLEEGFESNLAKDADADKETFKSLVDSLEAVNTSNAIYLRTGIRWNNGKMGYLRNITLSNIKVEVPATKADAGYSYEGPIEDLPRNISPSGIVGIPELPIENITLKNIEIIYPGGGNKLYAYRGTSDEELDSIPEMKDVYPEFSQFKELPSWGLFIRHAKGITLDNVRLVAGAKDYRPAIVADDVQGLEIKNLKTEEPSSKGKKQVVKRNVR